jgi:dTDP-4-amino-4,6-dideoxygalactose transaminase
MRDVIPLFKVFVNKDVDKSILEVLHSGYIGEGQSVKKFENLLSDLWKVKQENIITLNSGTSSLDLAMHLCGIGEGDEVISTPITCFATNVHLKHRKAKIVWVDIEPITGLVDCKSIKKKISSKTKAIVVVDYGGNSCNYTEIRKLGIPIIEDAAHAILTKHNGELISKNGGDFICFSFQAIKHLTCGDGGALIVPDAYSHRAKLLKWYGFNRDSSESFRCSQDVTEAGYKYHMNNINATVGISNLPFVEEIVNKHRKNAQFFCSNISNKKVTIPVYDPESSYWLFTLLVEDRVGFMNYMKDNSVATSQVHNRNDIYTIFKDFKDNNLTGVNYFSNRNVSIPVGWWLEEKDIQYICEVINKW